MKPTNMQRVKKEKKKFLQTGIGPFNIIFRQTQ